jgi:hypothetical protein
MQKERIVYNSSSSTHSSVKKTSEPTYALPIKKKKKVTPPKKGITRHGRRGAVKRKGKGKPTKKRKSTNSLNTVYEALNLQKKSVSKNPKRPNSVTYATLRFPNQRNTRLSNKENVIKESVIEVMKKVGNATPLSESEAQKLVNNAMERK